MTLPQNVEDAVDYIDASGFKGAPTYESSWQTIRAHLMSQEADIARLNAEWHEMFNRALLAESRLAAANALLRECYEWLFESLSDGPRVSEGAIEKHYYTPLLEAFHERIQSHLQGAGDEA